MDASIIRHRVPLRFAFSLGAATLLVIGTVGYGVSAYRAARRAVLEATEGRAQATAYNVAQRAAAAFATQRRDVLAVARDPAILRALRTGKASPTALAVLGSLGRDTVGTVGVGLRSVAGATVASLAGVPLPDWTRAPLHESDSVYFTPVVARGSVTYFETVAPVRDGTRLVGSVVRIRRLTAQPRSIALVSELLGRGGELLFGNRDGTLWTNTAVPVPGPKHPADRRYRRSDRDFIAGTYPISDTPFLIAVGFPEEGVFTSVNRLVWLFLAIGAVVVLAGLAVSWWIAGYLVRPLKDLAIAADAIATRHTPDPGPEVIEHAEIARLQHAFETMETRIDAAHRDLEQRVHELRASEERLRAADHRKDVFLATLAHELRNPLAPIRAAAQIIRLRAGDNREVLWGQEMIDRQVTQLSRLVDELLDIARISTGRLELRREPVELGRVLEEAIETCQPILEAAGHRLVVEVPPEPLPLHADPVRLCQVFANILGNAVKFTGQGGEIRITVRREGSHVEVTIADDGIGIAPEFLPHVFDQFSQAPLGRATMGHHGLGIGLSLARSLVHLHGGSIAATSEGLRRGSQFTVRLPLLRTPVPAAAPHPTVEPAAPRRVLIADDQPDSADSLARWLRLQGHQVETAYDGARAVAVAEAYRPEFVLLDIGMPAVDGYETCRRIRAAPWGRPMVLVALTGWGQEQDRYRTKAAGFDAHWVKPIDPETVLGLLRKRPGTENGRDGAATP